MVPDSHLEFSLSRMVTELISESAKKLKPRGVIIRQIKKWGTYQIFHTFNVPDSLSKKQVSLKTELPWMAELAKPPEHEINPAYQHPAHGSIFLGAGVPGSETSLAVLKMKTKIVLINFT